MVAVVVLVARLQPQVQMVPLEVDQLLLLFQMLVQQDKGMAEDQVLTIPLTMDVAVEADSLLREVTVQPQWEVLVELEFIHLLLE